MIDEPIVVLVPDTVRPEFIAAVKAVSPRVSLAPVPKDGPLPKAVARADVLFRSADFAPERVDVILHEARSLRWIHIPFAGVDGMIPTVMVQLGATITHAVGLYDLPVAEFALALILAVSKRLPIFARAQAQGRWEGVTSWDYTSALPHAPNLLRGRTVGILGFGGIGGTLAEMLRPLGVRILGFRRSGGPDPRADTMYGPNQLLEILAASDFVILALPLTDETRGLISVRELAAMRPTAWLINVGRGAVADEGALLAALEGRQIGGACLDVFPTEPLPPDHPYFRLPNVVVTPHVSGLFETRTEAEIQVFVDELKRFLRGEPFRGTLDVARGY